MKTTQKSKLSRIITILIIGFLTSIFIAPAQAQVKRNTVNTGTKYKPLQHYWSSARKDNMSTASQKGIKAAKTAKYRFVRQDGYVLSKASSNEGKAVPLYLFYSKTRKDYLTVASAAGIKSAKSAGYTKIGIEGYVLRAVNSNSKHLYKPLWLYYNASRKDNFTIASSKGIKTAKGGGYIKVRIEGYVRINNKKLSTKVIVKRSDPFARLKKEAQKTAVSKSTKKPVEITANNPNWKTRSRNPIKFVPFKLEDKNGKKILPNKTITLKNGKVTTAQAYINEINVLEKKLNAQGYSLRNNDEKIVSKTITDKKFLDGRRALAPKSIGAFKSELQVKQIMSLEKKVKVASSIPGKTKIVTLKPYSRYTDSEKNELKSYSFSKKAGTITAKKTTKQRLFDKFKQNKIGNLSKLYKTNVTNTKKWDFGNPDTFQASMEGSLTRFAIIYPFTSENPDNNKSEFRVKATGKAKGSIFDKSLDVLNASCQIYAPSDVSKKMVATMSVKALGINLFPSKSYELAQKKSFSKIYSKTFDSSFEFIIPLLPGLDFNGLIGVKGEVGFEFEAKAERAVASVHAKPIIDLKVYGEGGLRLIGLIGGGVEAELTFIKGELDLNAYAGIFNHNSEEIVAGVNHYFGYDIEILSGTLTAYGEVCSPIDIPFIDDCYRKEHELFKWNGFKDSGTISKGGFVPFKLANIAKYDDEPVFSQN